MSYIKDIISDTILPLIAFFILASGYKKLTAGFKIFFYYVCFTVLIFIISNVLADKKINNLFLYHIYTPVYFLFVAVFLRQSFLSTINKFIIYTLSSMVFLTAVINVLYFEDLKNMNMNSEIICNFLILGLCFLSLALSIKKAESINLIRYRHFLLLFGVFIHAVSSIVVNAYFKYKNYQGKELSNILWSFQNNILIAKYCIFILVSILCIRNKQNSYS